MNLIAVLFLFNPIRPSLQSSAATALPHTGGEPDGQGTPQNSPPGAVWIAKQDGEGWIVRNDERVEQKKGRTMKQLLTIITVTIMFGSAYADTETTKWYVDGKLYATTSCESGNDIDMPELPAQFGYTFGGWFPAVYDMSTLDKSINGTNYSYNTSARTWQTTFSYGVVIGESLCSSSSNTPLEIAEGINTENGSGGKCWCRVTDFIPTGSRIIYEPKSSLWAFDHDRGSASNCASSCTGDCGYHVRYYAALRAGLFGSVAN